MFVKDGWGENMSRAIAATGNISASVFYVTFVALGSLVFTNLFIGIIAAAFVRRASVHDMYREMEQRIVAQGTIQRALLRLRFYARVKAAARQFRELVAKGQRRASNAAVMVSPSGASVETDQRSDVRSPALMGVNVGVLPSLRV